MGPNAVPKQATNWAAESHPAVLSTLAGVTHKKERALRLSGAHRPTVKPDTDNYIKSTLDGLNGLLWADDNQIVDLVASKFYSDRPRVEIEVEEL